MQPTSLIQANSYEVRQLSQVDTVVFHHSDGATAWTHEDALVRVDVIRNWHKNNNHWPDIGYHFVIASHGGVYQTNLLTKLTYHVAGKNDHTIGVVFLGDYEYSQPSPAALTAAAELVVYLRRMCGVDLAVVGHAELNPASTEFCPSRYWQAWKGELDVALIEDLRRQVDHLNGVNTELQKQVEYKDKLLAEAHSELGALKEHVVKPLQAKIAAARAALA